ncbi:MAG: hypothetical protein KG012_06505 [Deltaproteobacteria bacterium]|nr:hypothetical protein [Deltaproteobacteria bacterium]
MKQGGTGEGILKILLGILGLGVLLVCVLGVLFSIHEWDKLEWFLAGIGIASVFWFIHHLKETNPIRYDAMMKALRGKNNTQKKV